MDAVNQLNLEGICDMYAEDAVLVPTFSDSFCMTPETRRDYFTMLGSRPGLQVEVIEDTLTFQKVGTGLYVTGGIYTWSHDPGEGRISMAARFSYVVDLNQSKPILHHHSSEVPVL